MAARGVQRLVKSAINGFTIKRWASSNSFNHPISGNELPRPAGIASMFRLPVQETTDGNVFFIIHI